jgi:hypothetical protein
MHGMKNHLLSLICKWLRVNTVQTIHGTTKTFKQTIFVAKLDESAMVRDYNKINTILQVIILAIAIPPFAWWCYTTFRPLRAELTISADSIGVNSVSNTTASLTVPLKVADYSPKEAHLANWSLMIDFNGASLQVSNKNCTHGNTDLSSAQQTEFVYFFDINKTYLSRGIGSGVFSISFIDDLGILQQQFTFYTPQWVLLQSTGRVGY